MKDWTLLRTEAIGSAIAAICCFTPTARPSVSLFKVARLFAMA